MFDLLLKPDLTKEEIDRIKKVAEGLYTTVSEELARIQNFAAQQGTRDKVKIKVKDYLWDDNTRLPLSFAPAEIEEKTEVVFTHLITSTNHKNFYSTMARAQHE